MAIPNTVLPMYLVLDSSKSMNKKDRDGKSAFQAAIEIAIELHENVINSPSVTERLRTEVIFFDDEANVSLELCGPKYIDPWYQRNKEAVATGTSTHYSAAFRLLKQRIDIGANNLKAEGKENGFAVLRPLVIFLTDGKPTEKAVYIQKPFRELIDASYGYRPNIICIGVGDATREALEDYAAGTVHASPSDREYVVGNDMMTIIPDNTKMAASVISEITDALVRSIVGTINSSTEVELNEAGIVEPVVALDDDFKVFVNKR